MGIKSGGLEKVRGQLPPFAPAVLRSVCTVQCCGCGCESWIRIRGRPRIQNRMIPTPLTWRDCDLDLSHSLNCRHYSYTKLRDICYDCHVT